MFDTAIAAGLHSVPHAGEMSGPATIWEALTGLRAGRIGHGISCLDDPDLAAWLRERQIPLEVCPTSNVCTRQVPDLAAHPLPRLLAEGLFVTLNSDDPPMFGTTLTQEYRRAASASGWGATSWRPSRPTGCGRRSWTPPPSRPSCTEIAAVAAGVTADAAGRRRERPGRSAASCCRTSRGAGDRPRPP